MNFKLLLLWAAIAAPVFAQNQGGGITQPGGLIRSLVDPTTLACTPGPGTPVLVYKNGSTDTQYTCSGATYIVSPGGSTSVLVQAPTTFGAAGAAGSNTISGPSQSEPLASPGGTLAPYSYPGLGSTGPGITQTYFNNQLPVSLATYIKVDAPGYFPIRFSVLINNSAGNLTTVAGSPNVVCSSGCNFTTTAAATLGIVIYTRNTANIYQGTILSVQDDTHLTLATNADVSASGRIGYWGTDSSAQATLAFNQAKAQNKCLYIPAGTYGLFTFTPVSGWGSPCIDGDTGHASYLFLGAGGYVIDGNEFWQASRLRNVGYIGGAGAFRNRFTGQNVSPGPHDIYGNFFLDYSTNPISFNSSDITYLSIHDNYFKALNSISTIGIAIAGCDKGTLSGNSFLVNQYHMKLGGCAAEDVTENDFIWNNSGANARADVWLVPSSTPNVNPFWLINNKFGNENLSALDNRVLVADTAATGGGHYFGDTEPLTTASTGYVTNLYFYNRVIGQSTGGNNSIFYSYTPNFRDNKIGAMIETTAPKYAIEFDPAVTASDDWTTVNNQFGPWPGLGPLTGPMQLSNFSGLGQSEDENGQLGYASPGVISPFAAGGSNAGFLNLDATPITSYVVGTGSKATITDAAGGQNAVTYTFPASGTAALYSVLSANPTVGVPMWIDVDLRQGSSGTSASAIPIWITNHDGSVILMQSVPVTLSSTWKRYRFTYTLRAPLVDAIVARFSSSAGQQSVTVDIGQISVYQSPEPLSGGQFTNVVDIENGEVCQDGFKTGTCLLHGTGTPSATTGTATALAGNGSVYLQSDTTGGVWQKINGTWVLQPFCAATGCQVSGTGSSTLTINRTGGSAPGLVMNLNGSTVTQFLGVSGGGARIASAAGANWLLFSSGGNASFLNALSTTPVATSALPSCVASTGTPWRASVNDATSPSIGSALSSGGSVFANVHCSLTTGTYLVDGL